MNPTMSMGKESICFPDGLQVLLVDADFGSLQELAKMSLSCGYRVTTAIGASEALSILQNNRSKFDIVISDINISDMDVFQFIEIISVDMDLPLVLMSANSDENTVMKGINIGACDYLSKPVQEDNIKFIWKHVVNKQKQKAKDQLQKEANVYLQKQTSLSSNTVNEKDTERNIIGSSKIGGVETDEIPQKKHRIVWTPHLHEEFVKIVNKLGVKDAVPKRILEMMKGRGLSRENVASHLQKYRLYLRKLEQTAEEKAFVQSEALHLHCSPRMYAGNIQNQVSSGQKRSSTYLMSCRPGINPYPIEHYGVAQSRYGMQMGNLAKQERLSPSISMDSDQLSPLDQFSRFEICNGSVLANLTSSLMESPYKVQKLSHDVADLSDAVWPSAATFPSTRNDVSPGLPSQFRENEFSLVNDNYMTYSDVPQSSPELIAPAQHFNLENTISYPEQHVGRFNGHHTDNNSTQ